MDEDIIIPIAGMGMIVILSIGVPLVLAYVKRWEREGLRPKGEPESTARLERIEQSIDAMAVEVERISEGQRFVAKLMAERQPERLPLPGAADRSHPEQR